jgi:glycerol-3-phosphate dehydrogenase
MLNSENFDLVVIGGGVNGTGIAADAAGRGLKVLLCEMNDLASATSSHSSKLIHGGLRYLEYYEFRLVREALAEREVLLQNAPHIIKPLRFQLPHRPHLRPAWMIRAGLFLYDNLAKRATLAKSKSIKFDGSCPLNNTMTKGFEYSDAAVDDARLVICNALSAAEQGAKVVVRTKCIDAKRVAGFWEITLESDDGVQVIRSKAVANAAGPWVASLFDEAMHEESPKKIRLVKGSHIIVPRIHDLTHAYILQNEDGRIVFVIPHENDFSLIGTTDVEYQGDPSKVAIDEDEVDYLIAVTNQHFKHQIDKNDVVRTYSGVRPLLNDESDSAQAVTRDYTFEVTTQQGNLPLLSVFGGKITTYRKLAQAAVDKLCEFFPEASGAWTKDAVLPGGDFTSQNQLSKDLQQSYPWLTPQLIARFVRSYGTLCHKFLRSKNSIDSLGEPFGFGLFQAEVDYLIDEEWAHTLDDVIWRRTKLGMYLSAEQKQCLEHYIAEKLNEDGPEMTKKVAV